MGFGPCQSGLIPTDIDVFRPDRCIADKASGEPSENNSPSAYAILAPRAPNTLAIKPREPARLPSPRIRA